MRKMLSYEASSFFRMKATFYRVQIKKSKNFVIFKPINFAKVLKIEGYFDMFTFCTGICKYQLKQYAVFR